MPVVRRGWAAESSTKVGATQLPEGENFARAFLATIDVCLRCPGRRSRSFRADVRHGVLERFKVRPDLGQIHVIEHREHGWRAMTQGRSVLGGATHRADATDDDRIHGIRSTHIEDDVLELRPGHQQLRNRVGFELHLLVRGRSNPADGPHDDRITLERDWEKFDCSGSRTGASADCSPPPRSAPRP